MSGFGMVRKGPLSELRADAALPASGAWDDASEATVLRVHDLSQVSVFVDYTEGTSGGGVEYRIESSPVSDGDDWYPAEEVIDETAVASSGEARIFPVRTASMRLAGTQAGPVHTIDVGGAERVRVLAREVGVTATPGDFRVRARGIALGA